MDRRELLVAKGGSRSREIAPISDRERAGRGRVLTVSEDSTKTEYDPGGRLISNRRLANSGSKSADFVSVETRSYDSSCRLLIDTYRIGNAAPVQKVYSYDDQGSLRIVDSSGDHTSFQYDEQGRKTEIRDLAHQSDD